MKQLFFYLFCLSLMISCTSKVNLPSHLTELHFNDLIDGNGSRVESNTQLTVHYRGWLYDPTADEGKGKEFENTYKDDQPMTFNLGQGMVIRGWDQGLLGMKAGGKRLLKVPANLAYGERSMGPISPNSDLVFEVEVLKVK